MKGCNSRSGGWKIYVYTPREKKLDIVMTPPSPAPSPHFNVDCGSPKQPRIEDSRSRGRCRRSQHCIWGAGGCSEMSSFFSRGGLACCTLCDVHKSSSSRSFLPLALVLLSVQHVVKCEAKHKYVREGLMCELWRNPQNCNKTVRNL